MSDLAAVLARLDKITPGPWTHESSGSITNRKQGGEMSLASLEERARAIVGIENWYPWRFRAVHGGVLCTGAVCPLLTRGKNKGRPDFSKRDPKTERDVFVPSQRDGGKK